MSPTVVVDLVKNIQSAWKRYRSRPSKTLDKAVIEVCFIRHFFTSDCVRIRDDNIGKISVFAYEREETYECHRFVVTGDDAIDGPTGESLYFYYFGGSGPYKGTNYGLIIQDRDDNVLYWREVGQNPRTEWLINCLANDMEDEDEHFVFTGEPVTI